MNPDHDPANYAPDLPPPGTTVCPFCFETIYPQDQHCEGCGETMRCPTIENRPEPFEEIVRWVHQQTGANRGRISITYRPDVEDPSDPYPWTVGIVGTMVRSRKGYTYTAEGFGRNMSEAAEEAVKSFRHCIDNHTIKDPRK